MATRHTPMLIAADATVLALCLTLAAALRRLSGSNWSLAWAAAFAAAILWRDYARARR